MDQHRFPSFFRRPLVGLALLAVAALVVGLVALPSGTPDQPAVRPAASYASLQDALRDGRGKGLDKGSFDIWMSISPTPDVPTAWVWVVDDTSDGNGVEFWAYSPEYVHPGADKDAVQTFRFHDVDHPSVEAFLDWIVAKNPHVDRESLYVVKNVVSPVE